MIIDRLALLTLIIASQIALSPKLPLQAKTSSSCNVMNERPSDETFSLADRLMTSGGSGSFMTKDGTAGADFTMTIVRQSVADQDVDITIDGKRLVIQSLYVQPEADLLSKPDAISSDNIIRSLEIISECMLEGSYPAIDAQMTDFGLAWMIAGTDVFLTKESPLSYLSPGGSRSRSIGSLPLDVYDMRLLSDSRVAVMIGDGSLRNDLPRDLTNWAEGSLWVFEHVDSTWKIVAVFGGLVAEGYTWINVPSGDPTLDAT